jgi:hypothetical protein
MYENECECWERLWEEPNQTTERKIQHSLGRELAIIAVLVGGRERGAGANSIVKKKNRFVLNVQSLTY